MIPLPTPIEGDIYYDATLKQLRIYLDDLGNEVFGWFEVAKLPEDEPIFKRLNTTKKALLKCVAGLEVDRG
jgi:hypothetical protein